MSNCKSIKPLFVIIIALLITGCAAFRSEIKGEFDGTPSKNYQAEKVNILFIFRHVRQKHGYDAVPKLVNPRHQIGGFDDIFNDALQEISNIKHMPHLPIMHRMSTNRNGGH